MLVLNVAQLLDCFGSAFVRSGEFTRCLSSCFNAPVSVSSFKRTFLQLLKTLKEDQENDRGKQSRTSSRKRERSRETASFESLRFERTFKDRTGLCWNAGVSFGKCNVETYLIHPLLYLVWGILLKSHLHPCVDGSYCNAQLSVDTNARTRVQQHRHKRRARTFSWASRSSSQLKPCELAMQTTLFLINNPRTRISQGVSVSMKRNSSKKMTCGEPQNPVSCRACQSLWSLWFVDLARISLCNLPQLVGHVLLLSAHWQHVNLIWIGK